MEYVSKYKIISQCLYLFFFKYRTINLIDILQIDILNIQYKYSFNIIS